METRRPSVVVLDANGTRRLEQVKNVVRATGSFRGSARQAKRKSGRRQGSQHEEGGGGGKGGGGSARRKHKGKSKRRSKNGSHRSHRSRRRSKEDEAALAEVQLELASVKEAHAAHARELGAVKRRLAALEQNQQHQQGSSCIVS